MPILTGMSMQPRPESAPRPSRRPELRIGDAERDRVCDVLAEHFQAGRLTAEEFDQRAGSAVNAVTEGDLRRLLADLPEPAPVSRPVGAPVAGGSSAGGPVPGGPSAGPSAFDVLFALLGVAAGLSLMLLFSLVGRNYLGFGFLACLGGATVAAVATHIIHRALGARRN